VFAGFVIFNYKHFGTKAVIEASGALLAAIAVLAAAWRQILAAPPFDKAPSSPSQASYDDDIAES